MAASFSNFLRLCGLAALLVLPAGCSKDASPQADSEAPETATEEKAAESSSGLEPHEKRALEIYGQWAEFRARLGTMMTEDGSLKLMLTKHQADRDFADPGVGGVLPVTQEGMKEFKEQFDKANAAAVALREEAGKIVADIRSEPPEVREVFWALMAVHGMTFPVLSGDGSHLYFILSSRVANSSIFESETVPLDPLDTNPGDDVYVWNLATGEIDCASPGLDHRTQKDPSCSADGSVMVLLSVGGQTAPSANLFIRDASGSLQPVLTDGPFELANYPGQPIPAEDRWIGPPSVSGDGEKIVFVCGTYVDRMRDEGYTFENYYLVLLDRKTGRARSLTQPVDKMVWPVISGDGTKVLVLTTEKAFSPGRPVPPQPGTRPSGRLGLFLLSTDGSAPHREIPQPEGTVWRTSTSYGEPFRPHGLSDDGGRINFEVKLGSRTQVYFHDSENLSTLLVSATKDGKPCRENATESTISGDGRFILFSSYSPDLNVPISSKRKQVYRYETATGLLDIASAAAQGKPLEFWCESPSVNRDGSVITFLCKTAVVPGTLRPEVLSQAKTYEAKRLAVLRTSDARVVGLGGRL